MRVIGQGAGGHAKVMIETLRAAGEHEIVGLLDRRADLHGSHVLGVPVLGADDLLDQLDRWHVAGAFIGVGGDLLARRTLYGHLRGLGLAVVSAIHPSAVLSPTAAIGSGVSVMAQAVVNAAATIGDNVIVNTAAIIEHDCRVANHVHIAPGAKLAGGVAVGDAAMVGIGAVVREGLCIGTRAIVGAGAVVVRDVPPQAVVAGVPARPIHPEA